MNIRYERVIWDFSITVDLVKLTNLLSNQIQPRINSAHFRIDCERLHDDGIDSLLQAKICRGRRSCCCRRCCWRCWSCSVFSLWTQSRKLDGVAGRRTHLGRWNSRWWSSEKMTKTKYFKNIFKTKIIHAGMSVKLRKWGIVYPLKSFFKFNYHLYSNSI